MRAIGDLGRCERRGAFRRGARTLPMRLYSANHKMGRKGREAGRALAIQELNASACGHVSKQVEPPCALTAAAVTDGRPETARERSLGVAAH